MWKYPGNPAPLPTSSIDYLYPHDPIICATCRILERTPKVEKGVGGGNQACVLPAKYNNNSAFPRQNHQLLLTFSWKNTNWLTVGWSFKGTKTHMTQTTHLYLCQKLSWFGNISWTLWLGKNVSNVSIVANCQCYFLGTCYVPKSIHQKRTVLICPYS